MKVLAIVASPRKGSTTDTLVDKAIEGVKEVHPNVEIEKINLFDFDIKFCINCLKCRNDKDSTPYTQCTIKDGMADIYQKLEEADSLIIGSPIHLGYAPGILTTFLERICWIFARGLK